MTALRISITLLAIAASSAHVAGPVSAQALAAGLVAARTPPPGVRVALQPSYEVQLYSHWPVPPGETDACNNRASETLKGSLRRVAGNRYEGRFTRRTRLGFCGRHGTAVDRCGAVLRGEGQVGVVGELSYGAAGRPTMALVWQAVPGTTRIRVEGSCAPRFIEALEGMYRTAVHTVDFAIPEAGHHRLTLEDYGRTLEIR
jgi:hypothetical protein